MMRKTPSILTVVVLLSLVAGCRSPNVTWQQASESAVPYAAQLDSRQGCTVFYAADGEMALGGNNEDYWDPFTYVWFVPSEEGAYGRAYFGYEDFRPQGGVNDQGLFFDGLAVGRTVEVPQGDKLAYGDNLTDKALAECATVACVLELFDRYHAADSWDYQFLFGDSTGDSAIVEPLAFIRGEGQFQVASNFYQSEIAPEHASCWRFKTATEMLESTPFLSVELFRDVLEATHQEGSSPTLYSNIYDLKQGRIYLYYFHDYDNVVVLDLAEELAMGAHIYEIASLFPRNEAAEQWAQPYISRYEQLLEERLAPDIDPDIYDAYVGQYEVPVELKSPSPPLTVIREGDRLFEQLGALWKQELLPQSETSFFTIAFEGTQPRVDHEVTFIQDETGRVTHLVTKFQGTEFTFSRIDMAPVPQQPPLTAVSTSSQESLGQSGFPWIWIVVPLVVLVALVAGYGLRKRSQRR